MNDRGATGSGEIVLAAEPSFAIGDLQVMPPSLEVAYGGQAGSLERRVMQVLVALARRRDEVVARDQLMAAGWGERVVGEDALHRCIVHLRKLGALSGAFHLENIPRVGYRLVSGRALLGASAPVADAGLATIAVLPFVNISSDPEQEYFSDGLTEEFICQLSQLSGVRVAGRTSAFAFKGQDRDLRVIGRELGVGYILEGSVRKAGARLRISARLVDCGQGFDLWSRTFDREPGDVFAIQEEVAAAVCDSLSLSLGFDDEPPDYGGTKSFEAYDQFLKAGRVWHHLTPLEVDVRAAHLRQALAIDPGYGLGWATLACLLTHRRGSLPSAQHGPIDQEKAQAAMRARELSPNLPEAHIAQVCVEADRRNWLAAEEHCTRAVRRGPGHRPQAEHLVAGYLSATGRLRAGLSYRLASRDYDLHSRGFSVLVLSSYLSLEAWSEFDAEYARSGQIEGSRADFEALRLARLFAGGADSGAIEAQYARILQDRAHPIFAELAAALGAGDETRGVFERWCVAGAEPRLLYLAGHLAGFHGHDDLALVALRSAVPEGPSGMIQQCWFPGYRGARQAPEFGTLMREAGLMDFWRASGKWPDLGWPTATDDFQFG